MRHNLNTGIFNTSYLNQRVRFDIQSAVMEQPSVDGLTCAFTHMSIRCDPRAPKDVPKHIRRALPPDQKILELEKERQVLYTKVKAKYGFINRARGTQIGEDYGKLVRKVQIKAIQGYIADSYYAGYGASRSMVLSAIGHLKAAE
jgi:hypothetical protein